LWQGGIAPVALVGGLILASLLVLVGLATLPIALAQAPAAGLPSAAFVFAGVLSGVSIVVRYRFTHYHIASQGVVVTAGWLTRRRVETTYEKVTDVTMYQGVLGRIFDFGSITINTAGSNVAPVVFGSVREPEAVKQRIDDARRAWEQR
jgi:membrane protein YdbS with pleckstrin-like domain